MAELTRARAADKAGVQAEYVDRLIEAGIIVPDADDAAAPVSIVGKVVEVRRRLEGKR